jgi:uncharacterized protein (DUF885 family)
MRYLTLIFLLAAAPLPAPEPKLEQFFDQFVSEWMRADPQWATFSQYFSDDEQDRMDRMLTPDTAESRRERVDRARRGLAALRAFDRERLTSSERVSVRVMEWQLDAVVRHEKYEQTDYVFSQMSGLPGYLVRFMTEVHPIRNARDAENYLARLAQVPQRLAQAISEARSREAQGVVPPKFILTATIEQTERLLQPEAAGSILVSSFSERMERVSSISTAKRQEFHNAAVKLVSGSVNPALKQVVALLRQQSEKATDDAGYWKLPDGAGAYADRLRYFTTTELSADQVHQTGLEQVARIEKEMDAVLKQLGYKERSIQERYRKALDDNSYTDTPDVRATILADYTKMIKDAERRSEALFDIRPKAAVVVKRIPEYSERNSAANYLPPASDGSRPGTFNVPLVGPKFSRVPMRTLAYHEAVPGHHFQFALQKEDSGLPAFRRDGLLGLISAFIEGWGLYAEALAMESGWYENDLPGKLGALNASLFRARRLVVDTGIHAKRWTRQQAIDYGISVSETERYVVIPGQACSYMIGQLKILELRDKARRELGDSFSLKEFHNVVLRTGSVPLEVLAEVVDEYIASRRKS